MRTTDFASLLSKYLLSYLPCQRGVSDNTLASYETAFSRLLLYCEQSVLLFQHLWNQILHLDSLHAGDRFAAQTPYIVPVDWCAALLLQKLLLTAHRTAAEAQFLFPAVVEYRNLQM